MDIGDDERFSHAIALFNEREHAEAAEGFEDLLFEAVYGEVDLARALLQLATGAHHVERGQRRVAVERIDEGLVALRRVTDARGIDVGALRESIDRFVASLAGRDGGEKPAWPRIERSSRPRRSPSGPGPESPGRAEDRDAAACRERAEEKSPRLGDVPSPEVEPGRDDTSGEREH